MFAKLSMQKELLKEALGKSDGPSQRREMAAQAVERREVSVAVACRTLLGSARPAIATARF